MIPSNSFLFPYFMFLIIPGFPLQCHLHVNLTIQNMIHITKFWLNKHNNNNTLTKQTLHLLKIILKRNYFQENDKFFQPGKGIAMGSPISSTIAVFYLQFFAEIYIKQWLESKEIIYYKRYVDDILITFDQNKTGGKTIMNKNNTDKHLEFKLSEEENTTINYLDLSMHRNTNNINRGIYRKTTHTLMSLKFLQTPIKKKKLASFNFYKNRILTLLITTLAKQQEWKIIL